MVSPEHPPPYLAGSCSRWETQLFQMHWGLGNWGWDVVGIKNKATEGKTLPKQGPQHYTLFVVHINRISWICTVHKQSTFPNCGEGSFHHVFISSDPVHRTSGIRDGKEISRGQPFLAFGKVFLDQKKLWGAERMKCLFSPTLMWMAVVVTSWVIIPAATDTSSASKCCVCREQCHRQQKRSQSLSFYAWDLHSLF